MKNKCRCDYQSPEKGITLVALIITIIVLVILAAVSINAAYQSGIIDYAVNGTEKYVQEASEENTALASAEGIMDSVLARLENLQGGGSSLPTTEATQPYLPSADFVQVAGTSLSNGLVIEDTSVAGNGNQFVWIEVPKTIYSDSTLLTAAELEAAVTSATDYTGIEKVLQAYASNYRNEYYSDTYNSSMGTIGNIEDGDDYNELYEEMLLSVYTHGGFWIGRYETGISQDDEEGPRTSSGDLDQTAVITKDAYPYNYVTVSQAQSLASNINSGDCTSSLMFGIQWDLVLKYLEEKGATQEELISANASISWGNYSGAQFAITSSNALYLPPAGYGGASEWSVDMGDYSGAIADGEKVSGASVLLTTGANETRNSKMNIIDLTGNASEYVLEYNSSGPFTSRGGACSGENAAVGRFVESPFGEGSNTGFRVSLY